MHRIHVLLCLASGWLAFVAAGRVLPAWSELPAAGTQATASGSSSSPAGLSAGDWSGICAAFEASRHSAAPVDGGYEARNPGQQWRTHFDGRGFTVEPDAQSWSWGLELVSYGLSGGELRVSEPREVTAEGQRVSYDWDGDLEEWWINDARGLEHGFTLHRRPWPGREEPGLLTFTLAVRGELGPDLDSDGCGVRFVDGAGTAALTYTGLAVFDADGKKLDARFERVAERLLIRVEERGARYPLTIDPVAQQAYLKASNTGAMDFFGRSVAISGETAVVGAPDEDSAATGVGGDETNDAANNSGAAYVFVRSGSTWSQQAYLKASNTGAADEFGIAVAISGDTLVIGAIGEDSSATGVNGGQASNDTFDAGAAYVFVRSGSTWSQQAYLKASNTGTSQEHFGWSAAISGDTLVVGAIGEDSSATGVDGDQTNNGASNSGAAYVFVRSGLTWSQHAYLKASNTGIGDRFGQSVAISGDTVVVGAQFENSSATGVNGNQGDESASDAGAVYVFVRSGTSWSQQAYLKASNTEAHDQFGYSVAISGDTTVSGAPRESSSATGVNGDQTSNGAERSGAAYVFVRSGTLWVQQAYLKATNTGFLDQFGSAVAIAGDRVLVGAPMEDSNALGPDGDQGNNLALNAGAAYVFVRRASSWDPQSYLKASNTGTVDSFGESVALSAGTALVGAWLEDSAALGVNGDQASNSAGSSGAAYALQICPAATVQFRNAGSNPASYAASPAVLGSTFTATVDHNLAGQTSSLLFAFDSPTSSPLGGGQILLCNDEGSGELFTGASLAPTSSAGGVDSYSLAVPNDPSFAGFAFCSQAIQFGNPPFVLSNAQDLTIGSF